ncbi:MAG: hypothetical protein RL701_2448 [Pseudomonadota bacterium]
MQGESDTEVLRRLADGDKHALGVLYDRHAGIMLAVGLRIMRLKREAEDVVHDVFLEVWRHAGDYESGRGSVKTWLLMRMRSRCLDRMRAHSFSRVDSLEQAPAQAAERPGQLGPDGHDSHDRRLDGARARALVEQLPAAQRSVLELGYFQGLSFSEIATQLDIPIGTVKSRVSAAMTKLRDELRVHGADLPAETPPHGTETPGAGRLVARTRKGAAT